MSTRTAKTVEEPAPFLKEAGNEESKDFRDLDVNYGASNAFMPIEEGIPNVTYYMLKANLAAPIPREMVSQKQKGYDKQNQKPIFIDYVNITDLKDLLDERVGLWEAGVNSYRQVGDELCVVVRISIHAVDGIFHSDGTGSEWINHNGFGDTFSNAYAQGFRRACEGHSLGRELWRKTERAEIHTTPTDRPVDNSEQANHTQERPVVSPIARTLGDMITPKQLGLIQGRGRDINLNVDEECMVKLGCKVSELSKRAASDFIEHIMKVQESRTSVNQNTYTGSDQRDQYAQQSQAQPRNAFMDAPDQAPTGFPASSKQKDYIKNICSDKGNNEELIALELFKVEFDKITKQQASSMIEHLIKK